MPAGDRKSVDRGGASRKTIGELGEFGFLADLLPRLRKGAGVVVGPGQDCAVVRIGDRRLLVTVDAVVEGVHFKADWISPKQLGRRSFLVNASDIAAMGGRPLWCVVSVGAPANYPRRSLALLHAGIDDAASEFGACIVGGNITASSRLSVSLTLIAAAPKRMVTRRGARPGDRIFVTGTVGDAALGVQRLRCGSRGGSAVRRYREPSPRLWAGKSLVEAGVASAMIDVSDGLVQDLGHICEQSGVGAIVECARLPRSDAYRRLLGDDSKLALSGGEDYELLCTVPEDKTALLARLKPRLRCAITRIGTVTKERRVRVIDHIGAVVDLGTRGYDHFARM